jgi:hypothetical protein
MDIKKQLKKGEWLDRFLTFSSGNRGRTASIITNGGFLVHNMAFRDIEYDPPEKGDSLIIAMGEGNEDFRHIVAHPEEIFTYQKSDGEISAVEIFDKKGNACTITFE